jgi:hypothetical protein
LPSRASLEQPSVSFGVFHHAGVERVADTPLEAAEGFLVTLALGHLALVVGTPFAVAVADLGDRRHVKGVVEVATPASGQPVNLLAAGGHVDGRGAVERGEVIPVRESGHISSEPDRRGGDHRADTEDLRGRGPRRLHHRFQAPPGLFDLLVEAAQVLE